jgi:hypothetical protein
VDGLYLAHSLYVRMPSRSLACRYRLPTALPGAVVHEELCETTLSWEVPSKFLKLQAEVLVDEQARLMGKLGEMESIVAANSPTPSLTVPRLCRCTCHTLHRAHVIVQANMQWAWGRIGYGVDFEQDVVLAETVDRTRKAQRNTLVMLNDLSESCAAAIRNYRTMGKYVSHRATVSVARLRSVSHGRPLSAAADTTASARRG